MFVRHEVTLHAWQDDKVQLVFLVQRTKTDFSDSGGAERCQESNARTIKQTQYSADLKSGVKHWDVEVSEILWFSLHSWTMILSPPSLWKPGLTCLKLGTYYLSYTPAVRSVNNCSIYVQCGRGLVLLYEEEEVEEEEKNSGVQANPARVYALSSPPPPFCLFCFVFCLFVVVELVQLLLATDGNTWFGHVPRHGSLSETIFQGTVQGRWRRGSAEEMLRW